MCVYTNRYIYIYIIIIIIYCIVCIIFVFRTKASRMPQNPQSLMLLPPISCWLCSIIGLWSLDGKLAPPVEKSKKASKWFKASISGYSKPCIKNESRRTPQSKLMCFVSLQYRTVTAFMTHGQALPKDATSKAVDSALQ